MLTVPQEKGVTVESVLTKSKRIWILEDDKDCQYVYGQILDYRYETRYFEKIEDFVRILKSEEKDNLANLVIADLMLEDGNFINSISDIKNEDVFNVPFFVVSSIDDIEALRFCFDEGALDYLTKPFKKNELLVKVENSLSGRRGRAIVENNQRALILDGVKIDNLTSKQMQLLSLFLQSSARSVHRKEILREVWGKTTVHPKTVDVHLHNLRKKLHEYGYFIHSEGGGKWSLLTNRLDGPTTPELS